MAAGIGWGGGFCANSKINGIKELSGPQNYGHKKNWSAAGVEQILERVSQHFESNRERLKERSSRVNLARRCAVRLCWDHAGLSHDEVASLFGNAQQQFGGSDDSVNQDPRRSNSEGLKATNRS
jgi:hypothetical protein